MSTAFTSGTTITSAWLNHVDDLVIGVFNSAATVAAARTVLGLGTADSPTFAGLTLTGGLSGTTISGATISATTKFLAPDGTAGIPSYSFTNDTTKGFYFDASNAIGVSIAGSSALEFVSGGLRLSGSQLLLGESANITAIRNGTNAQTVHLYNTYTDASNYERVRLVWSGNNFFIQTVAAGTGTVRPIRFGVNGDQWGLNASGHFTSGTDNTFDIGQSGTVRPRNVYVGTSIITPVIDSGSTGSLSFRTNNGTTGLTLIHAASAVNYIQVLGASTGNGPSIGSTGSDTDVNLGISSKGAGSIFFRGDNNSTTQFAVARTASAVNYLQVNGSAAATWPSLSSQGSDTNIGILIRTKGTGAIEFDTASTAQQMRITHTANAVNYITVTGAATGAAPGIGSSGTDTDVPLLVSSKGTSSVNFYTSAWTYKQLAVEHTASAVNYIAATGAVTTGSPVFISRGSDTNVGMVLSTKGSGNFQFLTNSTGGEQFRILHTASSVNYIIVTGSSTGNGVGIACGGSDSNVSINYTTKGTGQHNFAVGGDSGTGFMVRSNGPTVVNQVVVYGATTTNAPKVAAEGTDSNINLSLVAKGTGKVLGVTECLVIAASDETTALTTGSAKITFRMPYAFTLSSVRASLTTAQTSGSIFTVNIKESGVTILSTKITIDNTEKTSTTAATPPVISDTALADDAEITIDIDQVGDGTAKGLKVYFIGKQA